MAERTPIIFGNWKMHMTTGEAVELVRAVRNVLGGVRDLEVGVAPPFTALAAVARLLEDSPLRLAAQNCHQEPSGAYTGEISTGMLVDVGCTHVLVGHSERRQYFGEDDALLNAKLKAALASDLIPVLCVGEQLSEREADRTFEVIERQLDGALASFDSAAIRDLVIAYEPVWAIGTGKTASSAQAQEVHAFIRTWLKGRFDEATAQQLRIQYGGSVKPKNISGLMAQPDIDGALVGGASLDPESFIAILKYERQPV